MTDRMTAPMTDLAILDTLTGILRDLLGDPGIVLTPATTRPEVPRWDSFAYVSFIYWLIRGFGTEAQAGFAIGMRIMQSMFMPAMAISFAVPAVAGQNFGAGHAERVRETLKQALVLECALMALHRWP